MVAMNVWPTDAADGSVSSEARWRKMGRHWTPTGVCMGVGGQMAPTLAYPNLTVKAGAAWVDGHFCELPGDQVLAVTANGLVVVRFDPAANTAQLLYLDAVSVPAQSPTGIYEMPIAKITGSALTDVRPFTGVPASSGMGLGLPWNAPWGRVGFANKAAQQVGYDTVVRPIQSLVITRPVVNPADPTAWVPNRLLRVTAWVSMISANVASIWAQNGLTDQAQVPFQTGTFIINNANGLTFITIGHIVTTSSLQSLLTTCNVGSGGLTINPSWMAADDLGPAGPPP
jgi:hypothetical protein